MMKVLSKMSYEYQKSGSKWIKNSVTMLILEKQMTEKIQSGNKNICKNISLTVITAQLSDPKSSWVPAQVASTTQIGFCAVQFSASQKAMLPGWLYLLSLPSAGSYSSYCHGLAQEQKTVLFFSFPKLYIPLIFLRIEVSRVRRASGLSSSLELLLQAHSQE